MEVCFEFQFVEVESCGLEEAILEIVEVEEHTVGVELRLRIAVGEVESACSPNLYVRQFAYGFHQQFLLDQRISSSGITSSGYGVEERGGAKVGLQVAHLVVADGDDLRHRQFS